MGGICKSEISVFFFERKREGVEFVLRLCKRFELKKPWEVELLLDGRSTCASVFPLSLPPYLPPNRTHDRVPANEFSILDTSAPKKESSNTRLTSAIGKHFLAFRFNDHSIPQ